MFPLSIGQQALWYLHRVVPDSSAYHCLGCARIPERLDVEAFGRAVAAVAQRHPMLRATFTDAGGTPMQRIRTEQASGFEPADATGWSKAELDAAIEDHCHRLFDLENGPVCRFTLLCREHDCLFLFAAHHIVYDGVSANLVLHDLMTLYGSECNGSPPPPPRTGGDYRDFVSWQQEFVTSDEATRQLEHWRQKLGSNPPALDLPVDHSRQTTQLIGDSVPLHFTRQKNDALYQFARSNGVTANMLIVSAFQVLLSRYSGQQEFLIGVPAVGRTRPEFGEIVGYFINPIVLRADLSEDPRFEELLVRVRREIIAVIENQDYPFPLLVQQLHPERNTTRNPLFQVMIEWRKREATGDLVEADDEFGQLRVRMQIGDVVLEDLNTPQQEGLFDLTLDMREIGRSMYGELKYDASLFERVTIERMVANLQALLDGILAGPEQRISELPVVSAPERSMLIEEWNRTAADFPRDRCFIELFGERARAHPDAIAATFGDEALTYAELDARANRLARHLRSLGAGAGALVGVSVERSLEMLIALLAVQKSGGAYVPLDPTYPAARIALILEDSGARLLITAEGLRSRLPENLPQLVLLDADAEAIAAHAAGALEPLSGPGDLAYVIFTSGSTGRPKGVQIEHRALVNFLTTMRERPGLRSTDVLVAVTTISFDIAGLELFLPLLVGGRVVIASERQAADGRALRELLEQSSATLMQATPATWRLLLEADWEGPAVKALCGGEALPPELADRLRPRCMELWNMYGPTETTIWSLVHEITSPTDGVVPIGMPIANTQTYVLDKRLQPVPIGAAGQLYLGGDGLARGYWQRPELTAEKFIPDPFARQRDARLYATGDLVRHRHDGTLEFLGRIDHQVKVRGFRIELGEIEAVLAEHDAVGETVAVVRSDAAGGDARIVAYARAAGAAAVPTRAELRTFLRRKLPDFMIPAETVWLDELPRTPNGKIDRAALPAPEAARPAPTNATDDVVAPRTPMEELLVKVWEEILAISPISVVDDFFDLGGNSLLSLRVVDRIENETGVRMNPAELVHQTPRQIAARLSDPDRKAPAKASRWNLLRRLGNKLRGRA